MKKIIFILILTIGNVYAKPCMTDIYFGNGVWNSEEQAIEGKDALRRLMFSIASSRLNRSVEGQEYDFKHAYNPTAGTTDDLIETFYQLKESGQISDGYFMGVYAALAAEGNGEAFINKLRDIISKYNGDASSMFSLYQNASFNQRHNVLLVAHSQGNLFGNKMYTLMNDAQKKKFRMVSVATPADHVAGGGPHVTASGDYVIRPIPASLPSNIAGFGHTFIGTYLNTGGNAPKIIAQHVKSAYTSLSKSSTCGGYNSISMVMHKLDYIEVFGSNPGVRDSIGKVSLSPYSPPIRVVEPQTPPKEDIVYYVCSRPSMPYGIDDFFYYSGRDSNSSNLRIKFYDAQEVEKFQGRSYTITKFSDSWDIENCADVSFTGELYDLIRNAI